ncbi:MAG TPA: transketolase C-terminal domain-containing protein, partial [Jatrophihabitans sp.]|nr:transketolase C-terminal domain-containing protein [Jatrophihabitans sp.]
IASPSRPDDAAAMLRTCVSAARVDGRVCVFLEPIALYHQRDLADGDGGWLARYAGPHEWAEQHVPIGSGRTWPVGTGEPELTFITFGNGLPMSLRVAGELAAEGVSSRVLDLRWLSPLPVRDILREAAITGRVLVVDETRRTGGVSEAVLAALVDGGFRGAIRRVTSADSFIPLGAAARTVLLDEPTVAQAARELTGG